LKKGGVAEIAVRTKVPEKRVQLSSYPNPEGEGSSGKKEQRHEAKVKGHGNTARPVRRKNERYTGPINSTEG